MIGLSPPMFFQQLQGNRTVDADTVEQFGTEQGLRPGVQGPAQPGAQGHGQTPFAPIHDRTRQIPPRILLQKKLRRQPAHPFVYRQGGGELHDPLVQERGSQLHRRKHTGPIRFGQQSLRQSGLQVDLLHGVQEPLR